MPASPQPIILLIMEDGDESHAVHVLGKYHFSNSLQKFRRAEEARRHLSHLAQSDAPLPEMILVSLGALELAVILKEARKGRLAPVPVVVVAGSRAEELVVQEGGYQNMYMMGKPLGFFKLLEAMQKLGMYWLALRSPPA